MSQDFQATQPMSKHNPLTISMVLRENKDRKVKKEITLTVGQAKEKLA